jgi:hypothetical protein
MAPELHVAIAFVNPAEEENEGAVQPRDPVSNRLTMLLKSKADK